MTKKPVAQTAENLNVISLQILRSIFDRPLKNLYIWQIFNNN